MKRRVLRIPMPWTGMYWDLNTDMIRRGRKWFCIAIKKEFGCLHITIGFAHSFYALESSHVSSN